MSRRVLLIDDKLSDRAAILDVLGHTDGTPFPLERVSLLAEGLERLSKDRTKHTTASDRIAAIIVDLFLPDSNGIETFDQLLQATPNIPILVIATSQEPTLRPLDIAPRGLVLRALSSSAIAGNQPEFAVRAANERSCL